MTSWVNIRPTFVNRVHGRPSWSEPRYGVTRVKDDFKESVVEYPIRREYVRVGPVSTGTGFSYL